MSTINVTPPGQAGVNTFGQLQPSANTMRPNMMNGTDQGNGLPSMPKDFNQGLQKNLEQIRIMNANFEMDIFERGLSDSYRKFFDKEMIPLHSGSLTKVFTKSEGMDEDPLSAQLKGLAGWNVSWNEVSSSFYQIEVKANSWGRYMKRQRFVDDLSYFDWFGEMERRFTDNAARTINNLAGMRLVEGSSKLYVASVAAFDPTDPLKPRLTLGTDPSKVDSNLTWAALQEAVAQMENYKEQYTIVNQTNGSIEHGTRFARIPGWKGGNYIVLVGSNGYRQLLEDENFKREYVLNGGFMAQDVLQRKVGINSPIYGMLIEIVDNPMYIQKNATLKANCTGTVAGDENLECAFVIGGNYRIGIELMLEGYTKTINVGYEEDKKVDPFGLLSYYGWMSIIDFQLIHPECVWMIPYKKTTRIVTGGKPVTPDADSGWKA